MATVTKSMSRGARAHACAFGKHPGWDDHIEDIGLDSPRLVWVKKSLYTEGIGGNIDSGAWDRLDDAKRLAGFKHSFCWRVPEGLLVGRLWSSKDGKGRTKYPMVVAAMVEGVPAGWALDQISPRLDEVESKVTQTSSAELVRLAVGECRRQLEDAAQVYVGGQRTDDDAALLRELCQHPVLRDADDLKLKRLMYEMERELAPFSGKPALGGVEARAQHIRVPALLPGPKGLRAWIAMTSQYVGPSVSILAIEADGQNFVDLIVGDPGASALFCVRASSQGLGLATDVPYTLDDAFLARAKDRASHWRGETTHASFHLQEQNASTKKNKLASIVVLAGLAVVAGVAGLIALSNGSSSAPTPPPKRQTPAPKPETPDAAPGSAQRQEPEPAPTPPAPPAPEVVAQNPAAQPPSPPSAATPTPTAPVPAVPTEPAPPRPAASSDDPRAAWDFAARLERARADLARLEREAAVESLTVEPTLGQAITRAAARADLVRAMPMTGANRDQISRDLASADRALAEAAAQVTARLAESAGRVRDYLNAESSRSPARDENLSRAFAEAVRGQDPALGWAAARERVTALRTAFSRAEQVVQTLPTSPASQPELETGLDLGAWRAVLSSRREGLTRSTAAAALAGQEQRLAEIEAEIRQWRSGVHDLTLLAAGAEAAFSRGEGLSGDAGQGRTAEAALAAIEQSQAYRELEGVLRPIMRRGQTLRDLAQQQDAQALQAAVTDAAAARPTRLAEGLLAWDRLAASNWPRSAEDLARAAALRSGAVAALVTSAPAESRPSIVQRTDAAAAAMWRGFVESVGASRQGLESAMSQAAAMGVSPEALAQLPQWLRYNALRAQLEAGVDAALSGSGTGAARDRAVRSRVEQFVRAVGELDAATRARPEVASLLAALDAALKAEPPLDLASIGPGSAGWELVSTSDDGELVTYAFARGSTRRTLGFRRVNPDGQPTAYLATSEMPLGVFLDVVGSANAWPAMRGFFPEADPAQSDNRNGPRVWEWTGTAQAPVMALIRPAPGDTSSGWLRPRAGMAGQAYYPSSLGTIAPPSADSPMTYVSPAAAAYAAALMGCRLPTVAEWTTASAAAPAANPNRRDSRWKQQYDHIRSIGGQAEFPASGMIVPTGVARVSAASDGEPAITADDGWLWFSPVDEGASSAPFRNLVGNVAEWVVSELGTLDDAKTPEAITQALGDRGSLVRVVGASALSPATVEPTTAYGIGQGPLRAGAADVGFRPAFSARGSTGGTALNQSTQAALAASGYLPAP